MEILVLVMSLLSILLVLQLTSGAPSAAFNINTRDSYMDQASARIRRETPGDTSATHGDTIPSLVDPVDPHQHDTNTNPGHPDSHQVPQAADPGSEPAPTEPVYTEGEGQAADMITETAGTAGDGVVDPVYDVPVDAPTDTGTHTDVATDTASPTDPAPEHQQPEPSQPQYIPPMHNPLMMSRPGEMAPLALPIHQDKTHTQGEPTAVESTGEQPTGEPAASETGSKPSATSSDTVPTDTHSMPSQRPQMPYKPQHLGHQYPVPYQFQHRGPMAMRQTGPAPGEREPTQTPPEGSTPGRDVWARQFRGPNTQQQQFRPRALPQRQAQQKNARPGAKQGGAPAQGKNQRAPPNWTGGGGAKKPAAGGQGGGGGASPSQAPPGMPPHPMFDYRFYDPYYYMYGPGAQGNPGNQNAAGGSTNPSAPPYPYPPYPPYPPYKMGGDMPDNFMNPAYNMAIQQMGNMGGPFPCTNMSDPMCAMMQHRMMAGGEMDMEGPYGEMDMEGPYELDIEGPMAFQMLRNMGMGRNMTADSHFPEITLNTHVLDAMQKRFGVNTTAGIQRMSSNPEFQAFMYQVLTHSAPVSLAEFNANLTKAAVNEIIRNLDSGAANQRIPAGNLNHAHLNTQGSSSDGASLTLDNHPATGLLNPFGGPSPFGAVNPWGATSPFGAPNPFGPFPGQTAQLTQNPGMTGGAQPGSFQALVQRPPGEGGEAGERAEAAERKGKQTVTTTKPAVRNTTDHQGHPVAAKMVGTQAATTKHTTKTKAATTTGNQPVKPTVQSQLGSVQTNQSQTGSVIAGSKPALKPPTHQPTHTKEQDIVGKDSKQGISKDQQRRLEKTAAAQNTAINPQPVATQNSPVPVAGGSNTPVGGSNTPVGGSNTLAAGGSNTLAAGSSNTLAAGGSNTLAGASPGQPGQIPADTRAPGYAGNRDHIPIGLKEAGLVPEIRNNSVPVKAESGYTSTGFAIAAGTIIALIIVFGPIGCMLWKMKEKRDERLRKKKAFKNRDMSENNIMESMIMNDFGKEGMTSVANDKAQPYDFFRYGKERYSMINADIGEMEKMSGNPHSPQGRLP